MLILCTGDESFALLLLFGKDSVKYICIVILCTKGLIIRI